MKLYELAADYASLRDMEDMDAEVLQDTLDSISTAMEVKALNIAILIDGLSADVNIIKAEEQRLAARRRSIESKQKWLKEYLQGQMERAGIDKFKTPTHTISLQNNPPALNIYDEGKVPAEYQVLVPERWEIDKKAVKDALKAGQVPGAELVVGRSLRIR